MRMHSWGSRGRRFKSGRPDGFRTALRPLWPTRAHLDGSEVGAERLASINDGSHIGMQVPPGQESRRRPVMDACATDRCRGASGWRRACGQDDG
jgi:hypothetical protein